MEDALDAFAEAADGAVALSSAAPSPLEQGAPAGDQALRAAHLVDEHPGAVRRRRRPPAARRHRRGSPPSRSPSTGGTSAGRPVAAPLPEPLAAELLPTALQVALSDDPRFAPPVPGGRRGAAAVRAFALLGRARPELRRMSDTQAPPSATAPAG